MPFHVFHTSGPTAEVSANVSRYSCSSPTDRLHHTGEFRNDFLIRNVTALRDMVHGQMVDGKDLNHMALLDREAHTFADELSQFPTAVGMRGTPWANVFP